jgi:hypothetical protein
MKHLLMASIVATVAIPAIAARDANPLRGARRMVWLFLAFDLLYVAYVTLVHATYVLPPPQP